MIERVFYLTVKMVLFLTAVLFVVIGGFKIAASIVKLIVPDPNNATFLSQILGIGTFMTIMIFASVHVVSLVWIYCGDPPPPTEAAEE